MEMVVLDLPLMFVWYDMIDEGEKPEEYRELKPHWIKRILKCVKWCSKGVVTCASSKLGYKYCYDNLVTGKELCYDDRHGGVCCGNIADFTKISNGFTHVRFRRGYTKTTMLFEIKYITIGYGNPKWGAPKDRKVFIIKLGKRIYETT